MPIPTYRNLVVEASKDLVRVRLNRPGRYNALDTASLVDLICALDDLRREAPLLLEGEGGCLSLGCDIAELANFDDYAATAYSHLGHQVVAGLEAWPGVTVAVCQGFVLGAGLELALGCDVLVGLGDVRLGLPGLPFALVPCLGGMRRLATRVDATLCSELFLIGTTLDAERALACGLLDRRVADEDELLNLARGWGEFSATAVRGIRELRLARQGRIEVSHEADLFAAPFLKGECQRRLRALLAG